MATNSPGSRSDDARGTAVTLQVMADHVDRYHDQVGELLPAFHSDDHGDVAIALVEAERALRTAGRLLRRAAKLAAGER